MIASRQLGFLAAGFGSIAILLLATDAAALGPAPLRDPTTLNIGLNCRWEARCMKLQQKAMNHALTYMWKAKPPTARIHRCNRNARRARSRIDWVGFDHCIRNRAMGR
jgi:hypothetical protein